MLLTVAALALAGCVMPGRDAGSDSESSIVTPATPADRVIERDVEAPEVFQVTDRGLWDGRPSLGGVWVAHPSATDPERVMIRNPSTGASVIGALFRRERDNPGPRFQISSEAASALGILAGAPTEVEVTALRLQRVEMEIEPAPSPATATAAEETLALPPEADGETTAETPTEAPAVPPARPPVPAPAAASGAGSIAATALPAAAEAGGDAAAVVVGEESAPRRGFFDRLFRRDAAAREDAEDGDAAAIAVPGVTDAGPDSQPATQPAGPARLDRPYVQIGIFSVESNATGARDRMQSAGLNAEIRRGRAGETAFWRVVVGPAADLAQRDAALRQVRSMGFTDAYAVAR